MTQKDTAMRQAKLFRDPIKPHLLMTTPARIVTTTAEMLKISPNNSNHLLNFTDRYRLAMTLVRHLHGIIPYLIPH
jgi:hypothetical protein